MISNGFYYLFNSFFIEKFGNMIMEEKDLKFFRNLLIQWMEDLLDHADETVEGLLDSHEILADPLDRVTVESDRIWTLRIWDRESKLIKKIRQSLDLFSAHKKFHFSEFIFTTRPSSSIYSLQYLTDSI